MKTNQNAAYGITLTGSMQRRLQNKSNNHTSHSTVKPLRQQFFKAKDNKAAADIKDEKYIRRAFIDISGKEHEKETGSMGRREQKKKNNKLLT